MKTYNDYPRPQLKRDSYISLNGLWDYKISKNPAIPNDFDGKILVPYSPETKISGVNKMLMPGEYLFYHLEFNLGNIFLNNKLILHFGAIDQIADIFINSKLICHHVGGFLPISFDIKPYLIDEKNQIVVRVQDFSDTSYYSRGKQKINRGKIWYTPQSGIYMPVWMESVSNDYIENIKITPNIDTSEIELFIKSTAKTAYFSLNDKKIKLKTNVNNIIKIDDLHLWSPEDPYLYNFTLETENDKVSSYFAMRKFSKIKVGNFYRLALNNKPIFIKGVLDQGYFINGFLTPEKEEDYINDITLIKDLGFNCIRKHIKIESLRFYHLCDKMGVIVWQDFVNGGETYKFPTIAFPLITGIHHKDTNYKKFSRTNAEGRKETLKEFKDTINLLYNSPCIMLWTIFNEGWGQFDSVKIYNELKNIDKTRLFDHASGWHDQGVSDVKSLHVYFKRVKMPSKKASKDRAIILSECGGFNLSIPGHQFNDISYGYKSLKSQEDFEKTFISFINKDIKPNISKGLSAYIYTQLSDVEDELNGFVTYDREVIKVNKDKIKEINDTLKY